MRTANREELAKVHYIRHIPTDGRALLLNSYYDDEARDWFMYMDIDGKIIRMGGGEVIRGKYWGRLPASPERDLELPVATLIAQHLSFPDIVEALHSIEDDVHQLAAIMEIYQMISNTKQVRPNDAAYLMTSEIEHLIIVIRSLYDLLQKLSKRACAKVVSLGETKKRIMTELPDSFADVALKGSTPRTEQEMIEKFRLPNALAAFYAARATKFAMLRDIRVAIEHHGKSLPIVFAMDEGMAVSVDEKPWKEFPLWKPELIRNNRFGPLRAVLAYLISDILNATTEYVGVFASIVSLPQAVSPGLKIFMRDPFGGHLVKLREILSAPWERPLKPSS